MTPFHVFILLSLTGTIHGLQNPADILQISEISERSERSLPGTAGNSTEDVGDIIETVNANLGRTRGGPHIMFGDIAMSNSRNAHPCTRRGCLWPKQNGKVYIPVNFYRYSRGQMYTIIRGLVSFHRSTCIRFVWRRRQRDYITFFSGSGCWSYVGRQGGRQLISLMSPRGGYTCLDQGLIQHEVLHALGMTHEQNRSDRDKHITIVTENIRPGAERNFRKVYTNNLATPYDYNSVMHYGRYAFSRQRGRLPTLIAKPNPNVRIGGAREMSSNDIARVNRLYCS